MIRLRVVRHAVAATVGTALLASGCVAPEQGGEAAGEPRAARSGGLEPSSRSSRATTPADPAVPESPDSPPPEQPPDRTAPVSDGEPRPARLTIPGLGLSELAVVPYRGHTDDAPGTAIQDRGLAASPHGPRGGVGPGGVGNYQVTAHRLSSTRAFEFLPQLRRGDEVVVSAGRLRHVYRIVTTRITSFRSERSLREQRAAVPGHPGREPKRAMITLSTCATVEDHAAGNYWSDRFHNPEHRIDKIGVLVATRRRA
jgi:sortase A